MRKNKLVKFIIAGIILSSFFNPYDVFAKSGCCSRHDGVNCSAGAQGNGKVICNDGNRGSSCLYSEMVMCGGSSAPAPVVNTAPPVAPVVIEKKVIAPTAKPFPTARPLPTRIPTLRPTLKPTAIPVRCSQDADGRCPSSCSAGNDADCCTDNLFGYSWYQNWGCYPTDLSCSAVSDGVCGSYCNAGNDADCCTENLNNHMWYENWGCYPKKEVKCSAVKDSICPSQCETGHDYDCCYKRLEGHEWFEGSGCYEK